MVIRHTRCCLLIKAYYTYALLLIHNSLQYDCAQLLFMSANYTVPYKRKNNHNSPLPLDLFLEMIPTPKELIESEVD